MKRSTFLIITALLNLISGVGMLIAPQTFMSTYAIVLNPIASLLSRDVGAFLFAFGVVTWVARKSEASTAIRGILMGGFSIQAITFVLDLRSVLAGVVDGHGWIPVAQHLIFAFGWFYYLFLAKDKPSSLLAN